MWLIHPQRLSLSMAYGSCTPITHHSHPSSDRLTLCLLNIAFQKVILDGVYGTCLYILLYVFKGFFCVCISVCAFMKIYLFIGMSVCQIISCFFSQPETRGVCWSLSSPLLCHAALRGIAFLIAVEKPHQCQALWFMSLNPSTFSSFPLGFTIFPPLFSSRRYRPCPGLSARPTPHTITPGEARGERRGGGSERSRRWGTTDRTRRGGRAPGWRGR